MVETLMINNASSIIECPKLDGRWRWVWGNSQSLQMSIDQNAPGASQCQGLADEEDKNHRKVPGGWWQGQVLPDIGGPQT